MIRLFGLLPVGLRLASPHYGFFHPLHDSILGWWLQRVMELYRSLTLATVDNEALIAGSASQSGNWTWPVIRDRAHQNLCKSLNSRAGEPTGCKARSEPNLAFDSLPDQYLICIVAILKVKLEIWPASCSYQAVCNPRSLTFAGAGTSGGRTRAAIRTQSQLRRA